jgi:ATP-dependent DNA helicase
VTNACDRFDLPTLQGDLSSSRSSHIINSLHAILKPFLLRRVKADVEVNLPPKKEYVLYAPLSEKQRQLYEQVLAGGLRQFLIGTTRASDEPEVHEVKNQDSDSPMKLRSQGLGGSRKSYKIHDDDDEYFEMLESGQLGVRKGGGHAKEIEEIGRTHQRKAMGELPFCKGIPRPDHLFVSSVKQVNNMKLQNAVMQLRKVCSHPFLFNWPTDPDTHQPILDEELVDASGKMMVLDRLLGELFKRGHKVLLFTQFTTMLDIIEVCPCAFIGIFHIDSSGLPGLGRRIQGVEYLPH